MVRFLISLLFPLLCVGQAGDPYQIQTVGFSKKGTVPNYEMNISYPKVIVDDSEVSYLLNLTIQNSMADVIGDFKRKLGRVGTENTLGISSLDLSFQTHTNAHIISFYLVSKSLVNAKKFGTTETESLALVFDSRTGKRLNLSDFYANSEANEQLIKELLKEQGVKCRPDAEDLSNRFLCGKEGLILLPTRSSCPGQVLLTWASVKSILNQEVSDLVSLN